MGTRFWLGLGWFGLVCFAPLAGCAQRDDPVPPLHPLTGTVSRDGRAVTAGGLLFMPDPPARNGLVVNAAVRPDGTFVAETMRPGRNGVTDMVPGAPAGSYRVVYHPPSDGSRTDLEVNVPGTVEVGPGAAPLALVLPTESPKDDGAANK